MSRLSGFLSAALIFVTAGATLLPSDDAEACGGFFTPAMLEGARRPSLSYEQVLLIHDPRAATEHFIREVTFDRADATFGFVVPTPTRPEVAKVDKSPFVTLRQTFPFQRAGGGFGSGGGAAGASHGLATRGVEVLEVKAVGSFTAFVLKADDAGGLTDWLRKNGLASTPEADRWLAHYVALGFYYVAMRYNGKSGAAPKLTSETVRISFATPAPYYPYFEPAPSAGMVPPPARLVDLWVVSTEPVVPVSLYSDGASRSWVRPMREGLSQGPEPFPATTLDPRLLPLVPAGPVYVQTFQDQKVSRVGYGDIVFAPATAPDPSAREARAKSLAPLLGALGADGAAQ